MYILYGRKKKGIVRTGADLAIVLILGKLERDISISDIYLNCVITVDKKIK